MTSRNFTLALVILTAVGCAGGGGDISRPTSAETRVVDLMGKRLALAPEVAWYKYRNSLPIEDPVREAQIVAAMVARGQAAGLDPEQTAEFFRAQMKASRTVQAQFVRQWSRGGPLPAGPPASLPDVLRPKVDEANDQLIAALAAVARGPNGAQRIDQLIRYSQTRLIRDWFSKWG